MFRSARNWLATLLSIWTILLLTGCHPTATQRAPFIPPQGKYDVRILRDNWGVPHIFGQTDADVAYGLGYAHSEDDWTNIEDSVLLARAQLASIHGKDWAKFDYLVQLFRVHEFVEQQYETGLSPETRALVEAYADGITHFAALNPGKMPHIQLPVTGKDIVAGGAFKAPFFYDLQEEVKNVFMEGGGASVGKKGVQVSWLPTENPFSGDLPIGSNAWAVGRQRSADGAVRLAINSHMPWTGPVTFYEAHLHSQQGWNMTGCTFPGGPVIFLGHDENKGWCHTISRPDLVDVYELELNPENPYQYKFDGQWRDLERGTALIEVRLFGPITWTVKKEMLWSVHGPVAKHPGKAFAIRFAGYGEIGSVQEWYRMNKARNLDEFMQAMRDIRIPSFNTLYADKDGGLFYLYNGQFPARKEGHPWKECLPGNTSETLWDGYRPFDDLPKVVNPASGFIQTCNSTPYSATDGPDTPKPQDFSQTMGIETHLTNRSRQALALYGQDPSITREEFYAYKFDKTYNPKSGPGQFVKEALATPPADDPLLQEALDVLKEWDLTTKKDSRGAALAVMAAEREWGSWGAPDDGSIHGRLRHAAKILKEVHGRIDIPWQDMMRLRRGNVDLGLGGGPDCLRAIDVSMQPDGRFEGVNGDCCFLIVEWDKEGNLRSEVIHQFGSATLDEASPHYADQAPLFANEEMRPTLMTEEAIRANLKKEYRPGELPQPWYAN